MVLHRLQRYAEPIGDRLIRQSGGNKICDLQFTMCEAFHVKQPMAKCAVMIWCQENVRFSEQDPDAPQSQECGFQGFERVPYRLCSLATKWDLNSHKGEQRENVLNPEQRDGETGNGRTWAEEYSSSA